MDVRFDGVRVLRRGRLVLDIPQLEIASGRVTALLGPNGAGKTTLFRAIAALDPLDTGSVTLGGQPVRADRETRHRIAMAFQDPVFVAGTVRENLELALRLRKVASATRAARIEMAAGMTGITALLDRPARRLSGGEAQRVNLARALLLEAPVTLLDEPLAGLDAPSREQALRDLPALLRASHGTVVVITHDRDEAARLADDVVLLLGGRVQGAGALADVFAHPPDPESARFLGWTVFDDGDDAAAIAPGALAAGTGDISFELIVERAVPVGSRWEVIGTVRDAPARLGGLDAPPEGSVMRVSASAADVRRYRLRDRQSSAVPRDNSLTG